MKQEEITYNTKHNFSLALKQLMAKKPLNKITVQELIDICNVNRKTFYYHFQDIYDCYKWTLEQEAIDVVKQMDYIHNFKEALSFVIDYIESNREIIISAYDSLGRDDMKRMIYTDFLKIITMLIDSYKNELNIQMDNNYELILSNIITEGLAGLLINLFKENKAYDKNKIIDYLNAIITSSIKSSIIAYPKLNA